MAVAGSVRGQSSAVVFGPLGSNIHWHLGEDSHLAAAGLEEVAARPQVEFERT